MSTSKEYKDFILEQLSLVPNATCRPMMGEYLLYSDGVLFGGIYDNRLLLKIPPEVSRLNFPTALPYPGAKPMYLVEDVEDKKKLAETVEEVIKNLK